MKRTNNNIFANNLNFYITNFQLIKFLVKTPTLYNIFNKKKFTKDNNFLFTTNSNLTPNSNFRLIFLRKTQNSFSFKKLKLNFIPIYQNTLIRFMEYFSGCKILLQFYPFVNQSLTTT